MKKKSDDIIRNSGSTICRLSWYGQLSKDDRECVDEIVERIVQEGWSVDPICREIKSVMNLSVSSNTIRNTLMEMIRNVQKQEG